MLMKRCPRQNLIHERHEWTEGRWRTKTHTCPGVEPPPPPMYQRLYQDAREVILSVWRLHRDIHMSPDEPGFGAIGERFYCAHCRMVWPCETARLVMDHGTSKHDYEPLRLISELAAPSERGGQRG